MDTDSKTQGTALITGAAKRIGKAIALHLAGLGYNIALHYNHSQEEAQATSKEIEARGVTCALFSCDLTDAREAEGLIGRVASKFKDMNVLINNASVFEPSRIKDADMEMLRRHFSANFDAPFILTGGFAGKCRKGNIINILDTHIAQGRTDHAAYLLSKKALHALTRISAAEFAPDIRVNAVAPGLILPPDNEDGAYLERLAENIPMRRRGDAGQVAASVEYLLTNKYVTGETIFVDGGEHLTNG